MGVFVMVIVGWGLNYESIKLLLDYLRKYYSSVIIVIFKGNGEFVFILFYVKWFNYNLVY